MKNIRVVFIFSILLSLLVAFSSVEAQTGITNDPIWISADQNKRQPSDLITHSDQFNTNTIDITIVFPGVWAELVTKNGENYTKLWLDDFGSYREPGLPALPGKAFNVLIPNGIQVEVLSQTITSKTIFLSQYSLPSNIIPAQIQAAKSEPAPPWTAPDPKQYRSRDPFPQAWFELKDTFQMRDYTIQPIWVNPIRYKAADGQLEIMEKMELRLTWQESKLDTGKSQLVSDSPSFDRLVSQIVINPPELPAHDTKEETKEGYLIITPDEFEEALQPFVEMKENQGYVVKVKLLSDIDQTSEAIKTYIKNEFYNTNPRPTYVLLIGDTLTDINTPLLPATNGTITGRQTDLYYATMDEPINDLPDFVPDIYIGRLPARTAEDVSNIVNKLIKYSNEGYQPWYSNASFIGTCDNKYDHIATGSHNYVISNYTTVYDFLGNYPETIMPGGDQLYCVVNDQYITGIKSFIISRLNEGRGLITYSGHGTSVAWSDYFISIGNYDIGTLYENNKYSLVTSFACETNDFGSETYPVGFGETWLLQQNKGAIGFIGSAAPSYWYQDDVLERKFYDTLFENPSDPLPIRIALTAGLTRVQELFPPEYDPYSSNGEGQYYWESYNLLGDPSQQLWLDPEYLYETKATSLAKDGLLNSTVRYPIEITNLGNTDSYSATIQDDEWPTNIDELINLPYQTTGTLWVNVKIPIDAIVGSADEILVTVSSTSNPNLTTPFKITTTALETFFSHLPLISK